MRLVIVTSADDVLGSVFAQAYYEHGGPTPAGIFVMEDRADLSYPRLALPWVMLKLFGVAGVTRIIGARTLRAPLTTSDRRAGIGKPWLATMGRGAPLLSCQRLEDPAALAALVELAPDVVVSIGAARIIKPTALAVPRLGSLNVHNGTLPRYRGHFGTFWEVLEGEQRFGVSIHEMTASVDSGRIVAYEAVDAGSVSGFLDLLIEKKARGGRMLADVLRRASAEQRLPHPQGVIEVAPRAEYYGWPTLADIRRFRMR